MPHHRFVSLFAAVSAGLTFVTAAQSQPLTIEEDFASDPAVQGWKTFGNSGLFSWNSTNQDLEVTWDSSQTNSYFYHPLGRVLRSNDDFTLSFDLDMVDAAIGGYGAQLAIGLLNLTNATSPTFFRGTGADSPNLVEFDYFPDPDGVLWYGPSITAVIVDSLGVGTNNWSTNGYVGLELPMNSVVRIVLAYTGVDQTLRTTIWQDDAILATVPNAGVWPAFLGFEVDTLAVESYSDYNGWGSILAHGTVGSIAFTAAQRPISAVAAQRDRSGNWQVQFLSATNWVYTLERTVDLGGWSAVTSATAGTGGSLVLRDPSPPATNAFYRVSTARP